MIGRVRQVAPTSRVTADPAKLLVEAAGLSAHGEQWAIVADSGDLYAVSNQGRVYSAWSRKMLRPSANQWGHFQVRLRLGGTPTFIQVHRLVAVAFIPNPLGHPLVRHLDDEKSNNTTQNLAWGTPADNNNDMLRNAWLRHRARILEAGEGHRLPPWAKLNVIALPPEIYRPSLSGRPSRRSKAATGRAPARR